MNSPASASPASGTIRLRIDLAYDGTEFYGWAKQAGFRTVQAVVERAIQLSFSMPEPPLTICAGRTDAGVHARGQVVHVDVPMDGWEFIRGRNLYPLRSLCPSEIVIKKVVAAPEGFNARFSALGRRYVYRICDDPSAMDPIRRRDVHYVPSALNVDAMNEAASKLVGLNNFSAFCRHKATATTTRSLEELTWARVSPGQLELTVVADAFCHSMVRSIVGSLKPVGTGEFDPNWPASFLTSKERGPFTVAPAHGLTFEEVMYPPDDQLLERSITTQATRGAK